LLLGNKFYHSHIFLPMRLCSKISRAVVSLKASSGPIMIGLAIWQ
jgi:hypothetical protein